MPNPSILKSMLGSINYENKKKKLQRREPVAAGRRNLPLKLVMPF